MLMPDPLMIPIPVDDKPGSMPMIFILPSIAYGNYLIWLNFWVAN